MKGKGGNDMATSSFDQKFYVSKDKEDEFVKVVTAPPQKRTGEKFTSHYMPRNQMHSYTSRKLDFDRIDRLCGYKK
jgi:hypothetical protein